MGRDAIWLITGLILTGFAVGVFGYWIATSPDPAELDLAELERDIRDGMITSLETSGTEAEGSFHSALDAWEGEIIGIGQPMPNGVYSSQDMDHANGFTTIIPAEALNTFVELAERQGVEVTVE